MARPKGVDITTDHAKRVADGTDNLAEIAAELGIKRQTLWSTFKRRGWPTIATKIGSISPAAAAQPTQPIAAAQQRLARGRPRSGEGKTATGTRKRCTSLQGAVRAKSVNANTQRQDAGPTPPSASIASAEEFSEAVRQEVGNVALLAINHARTFLSRDAISPNSLKTIMASVALSIEMLAKCGTDIDARTGENTPEMIIRTLTNDEEEEIRRQADAEYLGETPADPHDDDD